MNVTELRRQHVRDHVIPEACVTDREPWPCTIAQLLELTPTEPPADSPKYVAEPTSNPPYWQVRRADGIVYAWIAEVEARRLADGLNGTNLPRVNGNGFTPEQQKAQDFDAEPYPGNTEEA